MERIWHPQQNACGKHNAVCHDMAYSGSLLQNVGSRVLHFTFGKGTMTVFGNNAVGRHTALEQCNTQCTDSRDGTKQATRSGYSRARRTMDKRQTTQARNAHGTSVSEATSMTIISHCMECRRGNLWRHQTQKKRKWGWICGAQCGGLFSLLHH